MTKLAHVKATFQSFAHAESNMRSTTTSVFERAEKNTEQVLSRGELLLRSNPADWHVMNDRSIHLRESCAPMVIMLGEIVRGYRGREYRALDQWWKRFVDGAERVHKDIGVRESQRAIFRKTSLLAYKASWQQRFAEHQEIKHFSDWSHWLVSCAYSHTISIATLEIVYDFAQTLGAVDEQSALAMERIQSILDGTTVKQFKKIQPSLFKSRWRKAPLWFSALLYCGVLWSQAYIYSHYSVSIERSLTQHIDVVAKAVESRPGL